MGIPFRKGYLPLWASYLIKNLEWMKYKLFLVDENGWKGVWNEILKVNMIRYGGKYLYGVAEFIHHFGVIKPINLGLNVRYFVLNLRKL